MRKGAGKLQKNFYIIIGMVAFIVGNVRCASAQSQQKKNIDIYIDGQQFNSLDEYKKYRNETQEDTDTETDLPEKSFLDQKSTHKKEISQKQTSKAIDKKEDTHPLEEEKQESILPAPKISDRSNKESAKFQLHFLPVGPLAPLFSFLTIDKTGKITKQDAGLYSGVHH